jgi:alkylation response protein AidB-like acyl-CoA dehydrogenase
MQAMSAPRRGHQRCGDRGLASLPPHLPVPGTRQARRGPRSGKVLRSPTNMHEDTHRRRWGGTDPCGRGVDLTASSGCQQRKQAGRWHDQRVRAKITQIYEGTNQIQRVVMSRALLRG